MSMAINAGKASLDALTGEGDEMCFEMIQPKTEQQKNMLELRGCPLLMAALKRERARTLTMLIGACQSSDNQRHRASFGVRQRAWPPHGAARR